MHGTTKGTSSKSQGDTAPLPGADRANCLGPTGVRDSCRTRQIPAASQQIVACRRTGAKPSALGQHGQETGHAGLDDLQLH